MRKNERMKKGKKERERERERESAGKGLMEKSGKLAGLRYSAASITLT